MSMYRIVMYLYIMCPVIYQITTSQVVCTRSFKQGPTSCARPSQRLGTGHRHPVLILCPSPQGRRAGGANDELHSVEPLVELIHNLVLTGVNCEKSGNRVRPVVPEPVPA